jgi:hypothetical protein
MRWNWVSFYWVFVWFGAGFGIPEAWALITGHPENTLSAQVWHLEGLSASNSSTFYNPLTWSIPHFLVACGVVWLAFHFIDHIWH